MLAGTRKRHQPTHDPENLPCRSQGKEGGKGKEQHVKEGAAQFKGLRLSKCLLPPVKKRTLKNHQEKLCKTAGRIPIRIKPVLFPGKTVAQIINFLTLYGRGCQKLVSILLMPQVTKEQMTSTALQLSINIIMYNITREFPDLGVSPFTLPCLEGPESVPNTTRKPIPGLQVSQH